MKLFYGVKKFIPVLSWAIVILVLSVMPSNELPETDIKLADKIAHFAVYAVLSVLLVFNYSSYLGGQMSRRSWWFLLVISFSYGLIIEILQHCCIPTRFGELADAVANGAGSIFGLILARLLK